MTSNIAAAFTMLLFMAIAGWGFVQQRRGEVERLRHTLEGQGLKIERLGFAPSGIVTQLSDQYGRSRYVQRRFYSVIVDDAGAVTKQIWMAENGRLVRIS